MNRALLPQLQAIKVVDKPTALQRVQTAIAVFGHGSLGIQETDDYKIDMRVEADERGWDVWQCTLIYHVQLNKHGLSIYTVVPPKVKKHATH